MTTEPEVETQFIDSAEEAWNLFINQIWPEDQNTKLLMRTAFFRGVSFGIAATSVEAQRIFDSVDLIIKGVQDDLRSVAAQQEEEGAKHE